MIRFQRGALVKEGYDLGVVLQSGEITYDVVWVGGSTIRYRYDTEHAVREATPFDLEGQDSVIVRLRKEALDARRERKAGGRRKRGQVHPS